MFGFYYDPTYILVIIGAVLCILASSRVNSTYAKYAKVRARGGMTGAEAAQRILSMSGINDVRIEHVGGSLTDHYDPAKKVLRLSDSVYGSRSVAAIGVAAHECGHALQHKEGYFPLKFRAFLVPAANIGSRLGLPLVILSLVMGLGSLARIGVWVFAIAVLFQVVTLPVEFNASGRALRMVESYGIMNADEVDDCKRVLGAAALTYVAAAASSVLQLLRLLILTGNRRRDD
ncbi:zinc metallopeptidase [bacterium 1xD8-48]|jgi:Zn-dependent membrane protease YugP|nr:zinc metallopeptidase [Lachnospiraceae bacterium]MCI9325411.1 zinc metallopeptidase [Lachnospiraceae bacterium]NBJ97144.1 zinc metallopeptidase [bacterium 1xD8-48]